MEQLVAANDVVLYDRDSHPYEQVNLAYEPEHQDTVATLLVRLERTIDDEIGADEHAWVTERPRLGAWPRWHGDEAARTPS